MYSQILITIVVAFFISRVILRYKDQSISYSGVIGWLLIWIAVLVIVWQPELSDKLAVVFGIRRGTDVVIIASLLALFYAVFRIYVQFEMSEREITRLVRALALKGETKEEAPRNDTSLLS